MLTDYHVSYGNDEWGEPSTVSVSLSVQSSYIRQGPGVPSSDFEVGFICYERIEVQILIRALHEAIDEVDEGEVVFVSLPNSTGKLTMEAEYRLAVRLMGRLMTADDEVFGGMHSTHLSQPSYGTKA